MNKVGKVQIFFWSVKFTVTRSTELYTCIYTCGTNNCKNTKIYLNTYKPGKLFISASKYLLNLVYQSYIVGINLVEKKNLQFILDRN